MTTRNGVPEGWSERYKTALNFTLPDGVEFYSTPGHGFLQVDLRKHTAKVSSYDYRLGNDFVLLEEDCSMTMWLAEHGLIPMEAYIQHMISTIKREEVKA